VVSALIPNVNSPDNICCNGFSSYNILSMIAAGKSMDNPIKRAFWHLIFDQLLGISTQWVNCEPAVAPFSTIRSLQIV
jgi:hypothetical protein